MRNASRRPAVLVLLAMVASLLGVITPTAAQAASVYDGSYQSTPSVRSWWSYSGCDPVDMTYDWSSYVLNEDKWPPNNDWSTVRTSLQSALNNGTDGAWGVTQFHTAIADVVEIYWTEDATAHLEWSGDGVDVTTTTSGGNIHVVDVACSQKFLGSGGATPVGISSTLAHSQTISTSTSWSRYYTNRSLFVHGFDLNEPSGYDGESILTEQPGAKYVAMGDSFSSGEGIGSFESGTDTTTDKCHRSSLAYPRLLEANASLSLDLGSRFVACSGSHTSDILSDTSGNNVQNNEDAQINTLGSDTDIVTLTIGGNDIGFVNFAQACFFSYLTCNFSSPAYADALDKINNDLPTALENTYDQILTDTTASQAQIYIMGYPQVAPDKTSTDPVDTRCPFFWDSGYDSTGTIPLYWEDAQAARDIVGRINSHIESLIWDMREEGGENLRLHYVEVNGIGSPFEGHEMCSTGASYFQNLDQYPGNNAAPFHPNADGQAAYAQLLADAISNQ